MKLCGRRRPVACQLNRREPRRHSPARPKLPHKYAHLTLSGAFRTVNECLKATESMLSGQRARCADSAEGNIRFASENAGDISQIWV